MRPIAQRLEKRANLIEKLKACTNEIKRDLLQSEIDEINREIDAMTHKF